MTESEVLQRAEHYANVREKHRTRALVLTSLVVALMVALAGLSEVAPVTEYVVLYAIGIGTLFACSWVGFSDQFKIVKAREDFYEAARDHYLDGDTR